MREQSLRLLDPTLRKMPTGARRAVWKLMSGTRYLEAQKLKNAVVDNYTLKSFIETKTLFIHIPKAAGIAINEHLYGNYGWGHNKYSDYQLAFTDQELDEFYKFTIIRNPWSRLYSAYSFLMKGGMNAEDTQWRDEHLTPFKDFNDFVMNWLTEKNIYTGIHFVPQYEFLIDNSGTIKADYIARLETLDKDLISICERLGKQPMIPKKNTTEGRKQEYFDVYTPESIEKVSHIYARDISEFNYSFHLI